MGNLDPLFLRATSWPYLSTNNILHVKFFLQFLSTQCKGINMGGCKCISYENSSLTACAGDVLADALRVLEPIGRKLLSHGEYHYLSFGGMLATFNHGSNQNYNSIVDGLNWMEVYSLKQKSFEVISNLTLMKEVIASRAFIMTRANFRTEPDDWVITVTDQTRGKEVMDQEFLTSLDGVEDLSAIVKFETRLVVSNIFFWENFHP